MFDVGDIVQIYAPTAGKKKYHLCVCCANEDGIEKFLFINSGDGYEADFVVRDQDIDCLPQSPTGKSVISCSLVVRYTQRQLQLYKALRLGELDAAILTELNDFIAQSPALSKETREEVVTSIQAALDAKEDDEDDSG
jgi:hypothetical protein